MIFWYAFSRRRWRMIDVVWYSWKIHPHPCDAPSLRMDRIYDVPSQRRMDQTVQCCPVQKQKVREQHHHLNLFVV